MTEAFRGEFYQKVDSKARVSIPAAMRKILEQGDPPEGERKRARVVMIYGAGGKHVQCYSMRGAQALYDIIKATEDPDDKERLERAFVTRSAEVEIDDDGRLVLPPKVRDRMGVTAEDMAAGFMAAFAGKLDRFEIWMGDTYDAQDDDIESIGVDIRKLLIRKK